jgi:hypothetical protein
MPTVATSCCPLCLGVGSHHGRARQTPITLCRNGRSFGSHTCPLLSPDEIERMLADHRLYLETEYHEGHRAHFASADLTGRDFSGLNLRGIKMDRAVLRGANFSGAHLQRANLIGAILQEARFDRADLSGARLSGGKPRFGEPRKRLPRQDGYGVRADGQRDAAGRQPA